jgi:hypothetical protein
VTDSEEEAILRAREILRNAGGGQLLVHHTDGRFRRSVSVER